KKKWLKVSFNMPANKKYLTTSPYQKIAKTTAAFIGGYIVTETFFIALISWTNASALIFTLRYAGFILWTALMILAFISKNGWVIWGVYLLIALLFYGVALLGDPMAL
ncbi:hypothetical protein I215_09166, partial [Galbibacter marinus]